MLIKPGVELYKLRRPMRRALGAIGHAGGGMDWVLTSTHHDLHRPGSLHYAGLAIDFRKVVMRRGLELSRADIEMALRVLPAAEHYQLVDEGGHWHLEFDREGD